MKYQTSGLQHAAYPEEEDLGSPISVGQPLRAPQLSPQMILSKWPQETPFLCTKKALKAAKMITCFFPAPSLLAQGLLSDSTARR